MRFVILVFAVLLASCATPKTAPQSFYDGVFAPGMVKIKAESHFVSRATVLDEADVMIARKSAFARLLLKAKEEGYRSFSIADEKQAILLGTSFIVKGKLFKSRQTGDGIFRIDAIKRLLEDLPLEEPKPVVAPKLRKTVERKVSSRQPTAKPRQRATVTEPVTEEPLVIMAPEDITGSIRAGGSSPSVMVSPAPANALTPNLGTVYEPRPQVPSSLSGVPQGVILLRQ
jgi:hypothetical protein